MNDVTVAVPVAAGGAKTGGVSPSVSVPVPPAVARAGGIAPTAIIGPAVLYVIELAPDYHRPADHDDFVATGTEIALALAALFVGARLVRVRFLGR
jgi:hypothetical protein